MYGSPGQRGLDDAARVNKVLGRKAGGRVDDGTNIHISVNAAQPAKPPGPDPAALGALASAAAQQAAPPPPPMMPPPQGGPPGPMDGTPPMGGIGTGPGPIGMKRGGKVRFDGKGGRKAKSAPPPPPPAKKPATSTSDIPVIGQSASRRMKNFGAASPPLPSSVTDPNASPMKQVPLKRGGSATSRAAHTSGGVFVEPKRSDKLPPRKARGGRAGAQDGGVGNDPDADYVAAPGSSGRNKSHRLSDYARTMSSDEADALRKAKGGGVRQLSNASGGAGGGLGRLKKAKDERATGH